MSCLLANYRLKELLGVLVGVHVSCQWLDLSCPFEFCFLSFYKFSWWVFSFIGYEWRIRLQFVNTKEASLCFYYPLLFKKEWHKRVIKIYIYIRKATNRLRYVSIFSPLQKRYNATRNPSSLCTRWASSISRCHTTRLYAPLGLDIRFIPTNMLPELEQLSREPDLFLKKVLRIHVICRGVTAVLLNVQTDGGARGPRARETNDDAAAGWEAGVQTLVWGDGAI